MKIIEDDENGISIEVEEGYTIGFYKGELYIDNVNFSEEVAKALYNKMHDYFYIHEA